MPINQKNCIIPKNTVMNIIDSITKGMESVSTEGFVPQGCLLCEFCDLYQTDRKKCLMHKTVESCPAGKKRILIRATVLGTKTDFIHAYCQALNTAVLLSIWNYTKDFIKTPEGAVSFLMELENEQQKATMQFTPTTEMLQLGSGFADEVKRAWHIMMAYQLQKRAVNKNWWAARGKGDYTHVENPYGGNVEKMVKDHARPQDALPYEVRMKYIIKEFIVFKEKYAALYEATEKVRAENKALKAEKTAFQELKKTNEKLRKENIQLREAMKVVKNKVTNMEKYVDRFITTEEE